MKRAAFLAAATAAAISVAPVQAWAGGFEIVGNGTEALGRAGAFTAKASDATALEYNVAGLATQRGTRILFDSNILWNDQSFQRAGVYPASDGVLGPPDANGMRATLPNSFVGQPFPKVTNHAGAFYAPFIGISTDLGLLDRWTFAIGVYGPSSYGKRDYGETVQVKLPNGTSVTAPAPQRYDVTKTDLLLAFPTLAAAFRATRWLDIGLSLQLVYATFDLENISLVYFSGDICKSFEGATCDSLTRIKTSTVNIIPPSLGLMFHPARFLDIGLNLRPGFDVNTSGTASGTKPRYPDPMGGEIAPDVAQFKTKMPWVLRVGLRYVFKQPGDKFEHGDVELDGTYESWSTAEGDGDKVIIPYLDVLNNIHPTIYHHFRDTFSARLGGAYNIRAGHVGVFSLRAGAYFDSAASHYKDTRVDFDSWSKVGGAAGIGFEFYGVTINAAYAYAWSPDRTVTNGEVQIIEGFSNGGTKTQDGPTPVINNGTYHTSTQTVSLGITLHIDDWIPKLRRRVIKWD
jgi:long-subunit fatty acid transport protein